MTKNPKATAPAEPQSSISFSDILESRTFYALDTDSGRSRFKRDTGWEDFDILPTCEAGPTTTVSVLDAQLQGWELRATVYTVPTGHGSGRLVAAIEEWKLPNGAAEFRFLLDGKILRGTLRNIERAVADFLADATDLDVTGRPSK